MSMTFNLGMVAGAVVGTMLAFVTNLVLRRLNLASEDLTRRADETCRAVEDLALKATDYWVVDGADPAARRLQVDVLSALVRLDRLMDYLVEQDRRFRDDLGPSVDALRDTVTGGRFKSELRPADMARAARIQMLAADLVMTVRRAHRSHLLGV